jgi:hypothetical protein
VQEREQVTSMSPQVLGQALVGCVRLGREDPIGQLVLPPTAGHGQAVPADVPRRVAVAQAQAGPEEFSHPTRENDSPPGRGGRHGVGAA